MTSTEQQVQELNRLARLGSASGPAVRLPPLPLSQYAGSFFLLFLALVGASLALLLPTSADFPAPVRTACGAVAAACCAAATFLLYRRASERCTVTLHQDGVTVRRFGRLSTIVYEELRAFALSERESLNNGVRKGLRRQVSFTTAEGTTRILHVALDGQPDPFVAVLRAAIEGIGAQFDRRAAAGVPLAGAGWRLDARGLQAGRGAPVPLSEISAVGLYEKRVRVWRAADERPFAAIPSDSPNALVLRHVLTGRLAERPERQLVDGDLGRILFERRPSALAASLAAIAVTAVALGGLIALLHGQTELGPLVLVAAMLFALGLAAAQRGRTRFREAGVEQRSLLRSKALPYAAITEMSFGATRHYYNGVYTGTISSLKLAGPTAKVGVSSNQRGSDAALEEMRDFIAGVMSRGLLDVVRGGGAVPWGDALVDAEGLRFHRRKLMGMAKGEELRVPHATNSSYSTQDGTFHLFVPTEKKSVLDMACSTKNFYPGLLVFGHLVRQAVSGGSSKTS